MDTGYPLMRPLFPLFLDLTGREVLVCGGGAVATHKAGECAALGARVRVVAKEVSPEMRKLPVHCEQRAVVAEDVSGAFLVISATNDPEAQALLYAEGERQRRFVLAVDDPAHGSAVGASVFRRPPFVVALSSSGELPALTRLVREILESALPTESWIVQARALRARWKREKTPVHQRFPDLLRTFLANR